MTPQAKKDLNSQNTTNVSHVELDVFKKGLIDDISIRIDDRIS